MTRLPQARLNEARLALMFLTRLPVGTLKGDPPTLAEARWAYPLVGLFVGLVGWAVHHGGLALGLAPWPAAVLTLGAVALLTGGLHHDGLADFADGVGGGRDKDHCLEIMRDSRIGSYGVLALIFAVALAAGALSAFTGGAPLALFLLAGVASRFAMLAVLELVPPARAEGLGHSSSGRASGTWAPGLITLALCALVSGAAALPVLIGAGGAAFCVAMVSRRRIDGQTGDVLGAVQLISEVTIWVLAAAWMAP